ncbi:hypothetical protein [Lentibacillus populi]|uniref:hypothetical protein n=1 Tax=Lentibacillus populi TaxID=1827502 RepID=UPI00166957BB|nr:hypothetical protein [Lentibacillus populi]
MKRKNVMTIKNPGQLMGMVRIPKIDDHFSIFSILPIILVPSVQLMELIQSLTGFLQGIETPSDFL